MRKNRKTIRVLLCIQAIAFATAAYGIDFDAQLRAGVGTSDNIARTAQNEVDETLLSTGFDFGAIGQTNRLDLDIASHFDYVNYQDDTFDSELIGGLNGSAVFTLIDERLRWIVEDVFGQSLFDPFQPARPDNREDVNTFATGPTLSLLVASRNPVTLDLRYSRVDFETRPNDNDRFSGALAIGRQVSRESTLSLNLDATRIEFDNGSQIAPIKEYAAFARFETVGSRSTLGIDLGYNEFDFAGDNNNGLVARIDYTRQMSANGSLQFSAGSQYSEQSDSFNFIRNITPDQADTTDLTNSPAPFQNNFVVLSYTLQQQRYLVLASLDWSQQDFDTGRGNDRDILRSRLELQRDLTRNIFAGADIRFNRRDFDTPDRRDDDLILGVDVGYRISAGFDASLEYQYFQRDSSTIGADYTENRAFLRLTYTPAWSAR